VADLTGYRIGAYEVRGRLGAGAMGEVYLADDVRLGRAVAIKVLADRFTSDPDRRSRFEREARTLASLNHPHIGAIHGVEDVDGVPVLVLELVDGETLADRLGRGALPLAEVVNVSRQIADALDEAHERGIVHRDLKPANIKITEKGVVKVLDFGLAKAVSGAAASAPTGATQTFEGTHEGVVLGTAAYMSPQQARGQAVDKRTDIWAFGCVLYEMVAGRPAFGGATFADVLSAVIERDPDWTRLPAATPPALRQLLRRCLDKDPRRRLRDIGDAIVLLDEASAAPNDAAGAVTPPKVVVARPLAAALAATALVGAGAAALLWRNGDSALAGSLQVGPMTQITFDSGLTTQPSLSRDGRLIAYASNRRDAGHLDIYVQQATGGPAIALTADPADDHEPDVSPDGSLVAFRSERSPAGVYVAPALGGTARLIAPGGSSPRFSPDGGSIAFETRTLYAPIAVGNTREVFVVPASGGTPRAVATNLVNAGAPTWAPDGRSLLVLGRQGRTGADVALDWWRVPLDPAAPAVASGIFRQLGAQGFRLAADTVTLPSPGAWTAAGVVFSGTTGGDETLHLWRIAVDLETGRASGPAVRLTQGTTFDRWPALSTSGRLAWSAQVSAHLHFAIPLDANGGRAVGAMTKLRDDTMPSGRGAITEDGGVLVFPRYEAAGGGLWGRDLRTTREWQLAATPRTPLNPATSPDGRQIGYTVTKVETGGNAGVGDGYVIAIEGGAPRQVCDECEIAAWTRDGKVVFVTSDRRHLVRLDVATGARQPLIDASADLDRPLFGPDGTWMTVNVPGRIAVAPVHPDRAAVESEWTTVLTVTAGERTAGLSPDGRILYLLLDRDGFRCLYGLRIQGRTGQVEGDPFPVAHVHNSMLRWGSTGYGNAVTNRLFVLDLYETRSNVWSAPLLDATASAAPRAAR